MKFFHLVGLTQYPLDYYLFEVNENRGSWNRFVMMCPAIVTISIKFALYVACFIQINIYGASKHNTSIVVINILLICELFEIIAVFHQNFAYTALIAEILRDFQSIELQFRRTLHRPILFTAFKSAYAKKIRWAIGLYIILLISFANYWILNKKFTAYVVIMKIMQLMSISVYMYILFFMDLITFYLQHLNTIIVNDNSDWAVDRVNVFVVKNVTKADMIRKQLSKYKHIHFRLWKNAELVNESLGWMMLAILSHLFVDFVHCVIWQTKVLDKLWNFTRLTRKAKDVVL